LNCIFEKSLENTSRNKNYGKNNIERFNVPNAKKINGYTAATITQNGIKTPNNGLQGTSGQRGFPKLSLSN
jgi:hypothetical protein